MAGLVSRLYSNGILSISGNFDEVNYYPNYSVNATILVVAGGGGGGSNITETGGGGGAGGIIYQNLLINLSSYFSSFNVVVGLGGSVDANGTNSSITYTSNYYASNAVFLNAIGGGAGGYSGFNNTGTAGRAGLDGGSGGGGGAYQGQGISNLGGNALEPTSLYGGYGNNGAPGNTASSTGSTVFASGGGGGGAGAPGTSGTHGAGGSVGGNGGAGLYFNISGSNTAYGGGGASAGTNGGVSGSGGVGGGGSSSSPKGTDGTGGGGFSSNPGGSGIVIISYPGSPIFSGGTITTLGSNTLHTFTSNGSLIAQKYAINNYPSFSLTSNGVLYSSGFFDEVNKKSTINASLLAVAGGGAGGKAGGIEDGGGGGGAGGVINQQITLTITNYNVIIGDGGIAQYPVNSLNNGSNTYLIINNIDNISSSNTFIAIGGGAGGSYAGPNAGNPGGSGGGGSGFSGGLSATVSGGSGTSGQGNSGGTGASDGGSVAASGGGGGGAGAAGTNGHSSTGSVRGVPGGAGIYSNISGSNTAYGGGGGGAGVNDATFAGAGVGGVGGGGRAGTQGSSIGYAGSAGTGGGGGGGYTSSLGGNGGSGILILSYPGSPLFNGGTITAVGSNTVHTFTSNGTLIAIPYSSNSTPASSISNTGTYYVSGYFDEIFYIQSRVLIAAGGGAGAGTDSITGAGGGGAGGLYLSNTIGFVPGQSYTVVVGQGGAGSTSNQAGKNGANSSLTGTFAVNYSSINNQPNLYSNTFIAIGGGGGSAGGGISGGSGGGAGGNNGGGAALQPSSFSGGYGNSGGVSSGPGASSGGGGAGGAGGAWTSPAGGVGLASSITGTSVTYCTGGRGRLQSSGSNPTNPGDASDGNSSSGGGYATSFHGANGTVIISYQNPVPRASGGTITSYTDNNLYTWQVHTFNSNGTLRFF